MEERNVVFRTLDFMEATMVRSLLEGSGVEVHLYDENVARLNPFYSAAVGGLKLLVPDEQLERAREILEEYRREAGKKGEQGGR